MPIPFKLDYIIERVTQPQLTDAQRALNYLGGLNLSVKEARELLPRVTEHKWYISERLGRDIGWRVALIDYFENIRPQQSVQRKRRDWIPERLPMMLSLTERLSS